MPAIGSSRKDGLMAATPQKLAGLITDPPVCVPKASGTMPAPTAAAEPEDEPPGVWPRLRGFRVAGGSACAKAVVAVLPTMPAPAWRASITSPASALGRQPR